MKKFLKISLPALLFGFLISRIARDYHLILPYLDSFDIAWGFLSLLILLIVYPEGAYAWHKVLQGLKIRSKFEENIYTWIVSNTSRYIPGTIWQYVGRVELARQVSGIARKDGVASILAEVFFALVAAGLSALLAFPVLESIGIENKWFVLVIPLVFVVLHPKVSTKIFEILAKVTKRKINLIHSELSLSNTLKILPWFILNFLINGFALYILVRAFGIYVPLEQITLYTGFYAFSWLLGYIAIVAPGGIGVADVSLAYLLSYSMDFALASTVALFYRFLLASAEMLIFGLVVTYGRKNLLGQKK